MLDTVLSPLYYLGRTIQPYLPGASIKTTEYIITQVPMIPESGRLFVRIGGFSGAASILLGAYGSHGFKPPPEKENLKEVFNTGNKYHLIHSVALLAVPMSNKPYLTGSLLLVGMTIFSGSCYCYALTENTKIRKCTPVGGWILVAAWLSMIL